MLITWRQSRRRQRACQKTFGKASEDFSQMRDIQQLVENTLWKTFIDGRLYWCFAEVWIFKAQQRVRTMEPRCSTKQIFLTD